MPSLDTSRPFVFTKEVLESLQPSDKRRYFRDAKQTGFAVALMPSGTLSFQVLYTWEGTTDRYPIGKYNQHTKLEALRKRCRDILTGVDKGINPKVEKRQKKQEATEKKTKSITVKEAVESYCKNKTTGDQELPLKVSTQESYKSKIALLLGDDYKLPLTDVTEDLIAKKAAKITKTQGATACRSLSAVWNWTRKRKEYRQLLGENPVRLYAGSRDKGSLPKPGKRKTFIQEAYLQDWFEHVEAHKHGECLVWLILTGNRLEEARGLRWENLNFRTGLYTLEDTKNRDTVELPIPSYLEEALKERGKGKRPAGTVFSMPAQNARIRKAISDAAALPARFLNHDLRRSFATYGGKVCDHMTVKQLLNHRVSDITADYQQLTGADLVKAHRRAEAEILRHAGRSINNVVHLEDVS